MSNVEIAELLLILLRINDEFNRIKGESRIIAHQSDVMELKTSSGQTVGAFTVTISGERKLIKVYDA